MESSVWQLAKLSYERFVKTSGSDWKWNNTNSSLSKLTLPPSPIHGWWSWASFTIKSSTLYNQSLQSFVYLRIFGSSSKYFLQNNAMSFSPVFQWTGKVSVFIVIIKYVCISKFGWNLITTVIFTGILPCYYFKGLWIFLFNIRFKLAENVILLS